MERNKIVSLVEQFIDASPNNYINEDIAMHPDCVGLKIFETPIFAFGSADDEIYIKYKSPHVIGGEHKTPVEWLPSAKTVVSFFLPYTKQIKEGNAKVPQWPANEWLHGRIEGQNFLKELTQYLEKYLIDAGFNSISPSFDQQSSTIRSEDGNRFTPNWSERHVAYACGLGTFGLSKGLITQKGVCGRFGSILTELDLPKDKRGYEDIYEFCSMCGVCASNCPAYSISLENGKMDMPCSEYLDRVREKHNPYYGCGKCQVNVPCESGIPVKID